MSETVLVRTTEPIVVIGPSDPKTVLVQPAQTTVQVTVSGGESYLVSQEQGPPGIPGLQGNIGPTGPQGPPGELDVENVSLDCGNF